MRILFVIHSLDFADHISISYLSAIAKQLNHSTHFCLLSNGNFERIVSEIKPDVVAYSVNVIGFDDVIKAHKRSKRDFVSILGGPQATFSPETFTESGMDAFCVGEGEYVFQDFLKRVESKEPYDDIPNIVTQKGANPVRNLISNLDELPKSDRDLVLSNTWLGNTPKKTFYTTRGCPYKCKYCCNNYYNKLYQGKGQIARRFSVERTIREIEDVRSKYKMEFIKFGDDLFALRADEWLEEFTEQYSKRIHMPFNCYLRFDTVDSKLMSLLKKAGCYSVHLSVDSTSKYIREQILGRKMRDVDITSQLKLIHSYGVNSWVNFMLAVPESTLQDDLNSIEVCRKAGVTYPAYSTTVPVKGTELYDYCVDKSIIDPLTHKGDLTGCSQMSILNFPLKERQIRYNIFLLGALISKLPFYKLAIEIIKIVPPNALFRLIRRLYYQYNITKKIFKLA
jgi:anaerobic magnesium-protoporphyrin IX monomethyl ester cyclase